MWNLIRKVLANSFRLIKSPDSLAVTKDQVGSRGEEVARHFLESYDYLIVAQRFRAPIGRDRKGREITGEIDIIAYDRSVIPFILTFVEVKTRRSITVARPEAAVDRRKRGRIVRTARVYRRMLQIEEEPVRFDVISIVLDTEDQIKIDHLKGYFSVEFIHRDL